MADPELGFGDFDRLVGDLLAHVTPSERRRTLFAVARSVQASQAARIGRQQDPDGTPYTPRRKRVEPKAGNYALRFLYPKGKAEPRVAFLKSWVRQGPIFTGFDIEEGAVRSFYWDKVAKFLAVPAADENKGAGRTRRSGRIREQAMFRKLRSRRFLKAGATENEAWAGFAGRTAELAGVHQDGGADRPSAKARQIRYARRVLLGTTPAEQERILEIVTSRLFPASG